ncbi:MAG: UDP-N-acetylmuramoyl-L-alanyl-D-glutamate--2,6-diaminopimelate ligase [Deltaproteobacteria bacterium]|jgi:UDP-N-acetylmuramoyl-L-alanyl-D-glutamate--2,6-diaminopimelate ligase|nr:UDP-N-acetylmuramoyl-L-alanyl-D-glutamate--2,6-diaminopimelate ligase [Deltaproteobacteria bacterium]
MRLSELKYALAPDGQGLTLAGPGDPELTGLTEDSRKVGPGDAFAAVPGGRSDGRSFIAKAREAGAAAVLAFSEGDGRGYLKDAGLPVLLAPEAGFRETVSRAARLVYGKPDERLLTVAVTGTNGKTTTTYLLEDALNAQGLPCGVIGTIDYRWPAAGGARSLPAPNTTPEGPLLWKTLSDMAKDGARAAVLEVSSHALELGRLGDLRFDLAIFTNLSRDHLDFHGDMGAYFRAKRRLFTERLKPSAKKSVICADDPYGQMLLLELGERAVGFGLSEGAAVRGLDLTLTRSGLTFGLEGYGPVSSPLLGAFNALNILGALAAAQALGLPVDATVAALSRSRGAPGRLERVGQNDDYLVLVDYSHTPASVAAALVSLRHLEPNKLICVFGCGGDRDRGKRPQMAETAGRLADVAILTSDNPRTEDPLAIMADAARGFTALGLAEAKEPAGAGLALGTYLAEPDRARAIAAACGLMEPGDVLLIAGKGHEDYQIVGEAKRRFDDREEAKKALEGLGKH